MDIVGLQLFKNFVELYLDLHCSNHQLEGSVITDGFQSDYTVNKSNDRDNKKHLNSHTK